MARRSLAGGAKKRPTRYVGGATSAALAAALRAHKRGDLAAAVLGYRAAIEADPGDVDAWANLGAALALLGRVAEATEALREAQARAGGLARLWRDVGIALASIGRHEGALAALDHAAELDPSLVGAHLFAARVAHDLGDRAGAVRRALTAIDVAPEDPSAHLELFRARFDDRAPGDAIAAAARAVELAPDDPVARFFLEGARLAGEQPAARTSGAIAPAPSAEPARAPVPDAARPLFDALSIMAAERTPRTRFFTHRRDTIRFALEQAPASGDVVELGVRHGTSLRWLAEEARTTVHGFDSFEGLPEAWHDRPRGAFAAAGELPDVPPNVRLHPGWFADTLPAFVAAHPSTRVALLHVDADLFDSARLGLSLLGPHLGAGAVVVFDEYLGHAGFEGDERRAFAAWVEASARSYEILAFGIGTGQAVMRLR